MEYVDNYMQHINNIEGPYEEFLQNLLQGPRGESGRNYTENLLHMLSDMSESAKHELKLKKDKKFELKNGTIENINLDSILKDYTKAKEQALEAAQAEAIPTEEVPDASTKKQKNRMYENPIYKTNTEQKPSVIEEGVKKIIAGRIDAYNKELKKKGWRRHLPGNTSIPKEEKENLVNKIYNNMQGSNITLDKMTSEEGIKAIDEILKKGGRSLRVWKKKYTVKSSTIGKEANSFKARLEAQREDSKKQDHGKGAPGA